MLCCITLSNYLKPVSRSWTGTNMCAHLASHLCSRKDRGLSRLTNWIRNVEKLLCSAGPSLRCAGRISKAVHACRLKADRWIFYIYQSPLFFQLSCLCAERWKTGAWLRMVQVMCDDGAELSGPDAHQMRPNYARQHNEYFTKINHEWGRALFCWFHWEGRESVKPGEVLTGCLKPRGKRRLQKYNCL